MTFSSYSASPWAAPNAPAQIQAVVKLPGSKSLTNRELVLSALAESSSHLIAPLVSRDSQLMIEALTSLGAKFTFEGENLTVQPISVNSEATSSIGVDCGLAGTVMRFVPPLAGFHNGTVHFDGDAAARRRPMATTIDSLRALGVSVHQESTAAGHLPFDVEGRGGIDGGEVEIDASSSSQFVSGLLLAGAKFKNGILVKHSGEHLPSLPHIEMTLDVLRKRGVNAEALSEASWRVEPGPIQGGTFVIEPDLSNAGPFLAAAMVAGGSVTIPHWPVETTQVGREFERLLTSMGAQVVLDDRGLTITGNGNIRGIDVDLSIGGELTPVIAALAALADSPTVIRGVAHLRGHETDRLAALSVEINRIGGKCEETKDGLRIFPSDQLHGATWQTYEDHRMATAGAIIGLRVAGIEVEDIACTSKTMPNFVELWNQMLGKQS
jgi:3-phosphoshikimate 1-carboxyvinyltransferase